MDMKYEDRFANPIVALELTCDCGFHVWVGNPMKRVGDDDYVPTTEMDYVQEFGHVEEPLTW